MLLLVFFLPLPLLSKLDFGIYIHSLINLDLTFLVRIFAVDFGGSVAERFLF
jgi:hypothetical protein